MTDVFDVGNTRRQGMYILAHDRDDAADIAMQLGHVKSAKSARAHVADFSKDGAVASLNALCVAGKRGRIAKRGALYSLSDMRAGKTPACEWVMLREV